VLLSDVQMTFVLDCLFTVLEHEGCMFILVTSYAFYCVAHKHILYTHIHYTLSVVVLIFPFWYCYFSANKKQFSRKRVSGQYLCVVNRR